MNYFFHEISFLLRRMSGARISFPPGFRRLLLVVEAGVGLNYVELVFINYYLTFLNCLINFLAVKLCKMFIIIIWFPLIHFLLFKLI